MNKRQEKYILAEDAVKICAAINKESPTNLDFKDLKKNLKSKFAKRVAKSVFEFLETSKISKSKKAEDLIAKIFLSWTGHLKQK